MVVMEPPLPVKMPASPVSRSAENATVPLSLREGVPKNPNGPLLSAMVVMEPPLPVKTPWPIVSSRAGNASIPPLSLREGGTKALPLSDLLLS